MVERHVRELLAWTPYDATPDYPAKPEPGRARLDHARALTPGRPRRRVPGARRRRCSRLDGCLAAETSSSRPPACARSSAPAAVATWSPSTDLDLAVPAGGVHGFLGPNGSGKTTTIRMLLGLARPSRGRMRLFGEPVPGRLPDGHGPRRRGRRAAQVRARRSPAARTSPCSPRSVGVPRPRVDAALAQVGLAGRDRERYKGYSLGMKQRLAIAATLLKSPDLLILDEPTNGLDPAGIRDIRTMIRELGESGVTVLLSSHILAEVQQVCHSVSIIVRMSRIPAGSRPLVGSSRISRSGTSSRVAAIASRCFMPSE